MAGTIVSISLEDFITYSRFKFYPGPNLNVIIGPNGTGKSSIVCAMVLGLGGKPKILKRATNLASFIRAGCKTARIEIELRGKDSVSSVIITRIITIDAKGQGGKTQDAKTTWLIDGKSATQKQVEDLVAEYNIQVDNLCQFLPQDRVADFSKMDAQQLLENTLKCVGTSEMSQQLEQLRSLRQQYLQVEQEQVNLSSRMRNEEQKNCRLEIDVNNLMEKQKLLKTVEHLKQKRSWLRYDNMHKRIAQMKNDKGLAEEQLKRYETQYKPLEKKIAAAKASVRHLEHKMLGLTPEIDRKWNEIKDLQEQIERMDDKMKENIHECECKIEEEEQRRKDVNTMKQQISKLQNDLQNASQASEAVIKAEIAKVIQDQDEKRNQTIKLRQTTEGYQSKLENICQEIRELEAECQNVEDVANHRLEFIRCKQKDVYDAVKWLRENRNRFRFPIFEPMMLELNVPNPEFAKFVEGSIARRDLFAFTCVDKADMNEFLGILRGKNLRVSAVHSGNEHAPFASYRPKFDIQRLSDFGFHKYVVEMVTGPEPIMKYLCKNYGLHNIPVGDASTLKKYELVPKDIRNFYSDQDNFTVKVSHYSGQKSINTRSIRPAELLAMSIDKEKLQQLNLRLQELAGLKAECLQSLGEIQPKINLIENEMEGLRARRKELNEQLGRRQTVQTRLAMKQEQLRKLERTKLDIEAEKLKCAEFNKRIIVKLGEENGKIVQCMKEFDDSKVGQRLAQFQLDDARMKASSMENESHDLAQKCDQTKALLRTVDEKIREKKRELNELYKEAKEATGGSCPTDPNFKSFKEKFHRLPDTEEELDREIQDNQAKADCLGETNSGLIAEFQTRKDQIASLRGNVESKEKECERLKGRMDVIRARWLPPLQELVTQISRKYGECFARLQCAGEVCLVTGANEDDYDQYGLKIRVKYRDGEQLKELTQHLQSGGERAVATAIYMIALQELTRVPFCVVDEINQGMDAVNERMIFELLVESTRQENGAQYFLLTPKLLPAMLYNTFTAVSCVNNGLVVPSNGMGCVAHFLNYYFKGMYVKD